MNNDFYTIFLSNLLLVILAYVHIQNCVAHLPSSCTQVSLVKSETKPQHRKIQITEITYIIIDFQKMTVHSKSTLGNKTCMIRSPYIWKFHNLEPEVFRTTNGIPLCIYPFTGPVSSGESLISATNIASDITFSSLV